EDVVVGGVVAHRPGGGVLAQAAGGGGVRGADVGLDHGGLRRADGVTGKHQLVDVVLFDERQQPVKDGDADHGGVERPGDGHRGNRPVLAGQRAQGAQRRQGLVDVVQVVGGQAELLQIVRTLGAVGGLADLLHGGQEQRDEDADNGDHHQQLDEREGG